MVESNLSVKTTSWDYLTSVQKVRNLTFKWKNLSVEIVSELYTARAELAKVGRPKTVTFVTVKGWSEYLTDCDLERMTVHRWLERYIPEENRLLTTEESQERKQIEERKSMNEAVAIREMVIQRIKTGKTPKDWNDKAEKAYKQHLKDNAERTENMRKLKEDMEREISEKARKQAEWDDLNRRTSANSKVLNEAATMFIEQHRQRSEFKEKIRLSESGRTAPFIDAIMDYLDCLENDDRRIEACNNIVKVCRTIAVQLHQKQHGKSA